MCLTSRRSGCGVTAALNREYLFCNYAGDIWACRDRQQQQWINWSLSVEIPSDLFCQEAWLLLLNSLWRVRGISCFYPTFKGHSVWLQRAKGEVVFSATLRALCLPAFQTIECKRELSHFPFPFFLCSGWNLVLALPLTACVTLGLSPNPFEPLFLHCLNNRTSLTTLSKVDLFPLLLFWAPLFLFPV